MQLIKKMKQPSIPTLGISNSILALRRTKLIPLKLLLNALKPATIFTYLESLRILYYSDTF